MPASATSFAPSSTPASARIVGVPARKPRTPGAGSYGRSIRNWSRWPNQPWIGVRSSAWRSSRTYRNAGAPGPALRYL